MTWGQFIAAYLVLVTPFAVLLGKVIGFGTRCDPLTDGGA